MDKKQKTIEEIEAEIEELNQMKSEIKQKEKEKLKAEREERQKEVDGAYNEYCNLRAKFIKDYGYYTIKTLADDYDITKLFRF